MPTLVYLNKPKSLDPGGVHARGTNGVCLYLPVGQHEFVVVDGYTQEITRDELEVRIFMENSPIIVHTDRVSDFSTEVILSVKKDYGWLEERWPDYTQCYRWLQGLEKKIGKTIAITGFIP